MSTKERSRYVSEFNYSLLVISHLTILFLVSCTVYIAENPFKPLRPDLIAVQISASQTFFIDTKP